MIFIFLLSCSFSCDIYRCSMALIGCHLASAFLYDLPNRPGQGNYVR